MLLLRRALAIVGLVGFACMWGNQLRFETGWMIPCAAVFSLGDALCALALWRGWFWARWFGLGIGLVGTMNIVVWVALDPGWSSAPEMRVQAVAFPSLFLLLLGRRMADRYERKPSPHNHWQLTSWRARLLSLAVVLNIATAPMLLLHGCVANQAPTSLRLVSIAIALITALGVVLVIAQRSMGLLLMCCGGVLTAALGACALPALLATSCGLSSTQTIVDMTAIAAFPAGVMGAFAATLAFGGAAFRFIRRPGA